MPPVASPSLLSFLLLLRVSRHYCCITDGFSLLPFISFLSLFRRQFSLLLRFISFLLHWYHYFFTLFFFFICWYADYHCRHIIFTHTFIIIISRHYYFFHYFIIIHSLFTCCHFHYYYYYYHSRININISDIIDIFTSLLIIDIAFVTPLLPFSFSHYAIFFHWLRRRHTHFLLFLSAFIYYHYYYFTLLLPPLIDVIDYVITPISLITSFLRSLSIYTLRCHY